ANSTNSKPSIPIGFSNVVTCMPVLADSSCAFMVTPRCLRKARIEPPTLVTCATTCKRRAMAGHALLELETFLPYRLSVLSNTLSQAIAKVYDKRFDLSVTEWRAMAVLGNRPDISAREVAER